MCCPTTSLIRAQGDTRCREAQWRNKKARRTGVGKVAADACRDDVSIRDAYSDIDAGDNTDDNAGCRAAKKRPYSPQDYSAN